MSRFCCSTPCSPTDDILNCANAHEFVVVVEKIQGDVDKISVFEPQSVKKNS